VALVRLKELRKSRLRKGLGGEHKVGIGSNYPHETPTPHIM
jgi:hypothetical protein